MCHNTSISRKVSFPTFINQIYFLDQVSCVSKGPGTHKWDQIRRKAEMCNRPLMFWAAGRVKLATEPVSPVTHTWLSFDKEIGKECSWAPSASSQIFAHNTKRQDHFAWNVSCVALPFLEAATAPIQGISASKRLLSSRAQLFSLQREELQYLGLASQAEHARHIIILQISPSWDQ